MTNPHCPWSTRIVVSSLAIVFALGLTLAGCGSDGSRDAEATTAARHEPAAPAVAPAPAT